MTIIDAMRDPALFGRFFDAPSWARWLVFLQALFALPMTEGEAAHYAEHTGRTALPATAGYRALPPAHLLGPDDRAEVGTSLLVVGFPLGFHDTLHHMPVVRQAVIASSFGLRFQGKGYFLTDARTHRGTSGAPVVMRATRPMRLRGDLPWMLLGVHSARLDVGTRDLKLDEALGLNCAWYADILLTLTAGDARIPMPEQLKGATLPAHGVPGRLKTGFEKPVACKNILAC